MNVFRWKNLPPFRRDEHGAYLCRLCKAPCADDSRQWCSPACLERFLLMSSGEFVRAELFKRDRGICAECGVDGAQMNDALARMKEDVLHPLLMTIHPLVVTTLRSEGWSNVCLRGHGSYADCLEYTSCWEADHIHAVHKGGGQCGLENYRTLCFVCHKKVSAAQAAARKNARQRAAPAKKHRRRVIARD